MNDLGIFAIQSSIAFLKTEVDSIEHRVADEFIHAVDEIGELWPAKNQLKRFVQDRDFYKLSAGKLCYPEFEAAITRDKNLVYNHLENYLVSTYLFRCSALRALARYFNDNTSHKILYKHATQDIDHEVRLTSLTLLTEHEFWSDESTRQLLAERATNDQNIHVRFEALVLLAGRDTWADELTRQLLTQLCTESDDYDLRCRGLEVLAGRDPWADHPETVTARQCFVECIREGPTSESRGEFACDWFRTSRDVDSLRDAKTRVFSQDANGDVPYLDPRSPVSDEHLVKVADDADISPDQIPRLVAEMNAALGWDIRQGLGPLPGEESGKSDE